MIIYTDVVKSLPVLFACFLCTVYQSTGGIESPHCKGMFHLAVSTFKSEPADQILSLMFLWLLSVPEGRWY